MFEERLIAISLALVLGSISTLILIVAYRVLMSAKFLT
jgi:hypothetical protein